ncbi:hypothetical protein BT69DRAFT_1275901 [Atractiella rhizophila]|nr:hypothetical protein BT69DRAFT_1275901 [Atractiella rhizophila]
MTAKRLFIRNLPAGVTSAQVESFFAHHEISLSAIELKNKTYGFITPHLPSEDPSSPDAQALYQRALSLNGRRFIDSDKRVMIKEATVKPEVLEEKNGTVTATPRYIPGMGPRPASTGQSIGITPNMAMSTVLERAIVGTADPPILRPKHAIIDIGANLTSKRLINQLPTVLGDATAAHLSHIVITGTSEKDSRTAVDICRQHSSPKLNLTCTFGIHPHNATSDLQKHSSIDEWRTSYSTSLSAAVKSGSVKALGEMGVDYDRMFSTIPDQQVIFREQLLLARQHKLPVFLHVRDSEEAPKGAYEDFLRILSEFPDVKKCAHCYTNPSVAWLKKLLDPSIDCFIGITGWICDGTRGVEFSNTVKKKLIPLNRLMIETDAPFLYPKTIPKKERNSKDNTNLPCLLGWVLQKVAEDYEEDVELIAEQTTRNAIEFFQLENLPKADV